MNPSPALPGEGCVLILAPLGQDASLAARVLAVEKITTEIVTTVEALCVRLADPVAAVLVAEEAFNAGNFGALRNQLAEQPAWSDLPIILLTSRKERALTTQLIQSFFPTGGNISILERPFRTMTLLTATQVALRSRNRQYQVRDLLKDQLSALRQRDEFLSVASHELKTPITTIKLQIQMRKRFLRRGDESVYAPEKVNALLNTTENQVARLSRLVDDMLDVSRIENGKLSLNLERVELSSLVEGILEGFSAQFEVAGCAVTFEEKGEAYGNWDRYRLEQVIANLFTNAIKYGGGHPVEIRVRAEEGRAILSVRDRGMGIAPENHERVFKRFERINERDRISGLGLGLFITREIVEMHSGRIWIESRVGAGSTFFISLPLEEPIL
jgi:signal transduction histidine kinase